MLTVACQVAFMQVSEMSQNITCLPVSISLAELNESFLNRMSNKIQALLTLGDLSATGQKLRNLDVIESRSYDLCLQTIALSQVQHNEDHWLKGLTTCCLLVLVQFTNANVGVFILLCFTFFLPTPIPAFSPVQIVYNRCMSAPAPLVGAGIHSYELAN